LQNQLLAKKERICIMNLFSVAGELIFNQNDYEEMTFSLSEEAFNLFG